jgi:hypothetical protein
MHQGPRKLSKVGWAFQIKSLFLHRHVKKYPEALKVVLS